MASGTKERILLKALEMFSVNGYSGTNLRDLSAELGLSKSALYRHFESKEDIWQSVLKYIADYYHEHFGSVDRLPAVPESMDGLYEMTMRMVNFTIHDEKVIMTRKVLLTEQFHNETAKKLASEYFLYDTQAIFTEIFKGMMDKGILKKTDPAILAFAYTAPVTALIHLCDREPEREAEALEKLKAFINHFSEEYKG